MKGQSRTDVYKKILIHWTMDGWQQAWLINIGWQARKQDKPSWRNMDILLDHLWVLLSVVLILTLETGLKVARIKLSGFVGRSPLACNPTARLSVVGVVRCCAVRGAGFGDDRHRPMRAGSRRQTPAGRRRTGLVVEDENPADDALRLAATQCFRSCE